MKNAHFNDACQRFVHLNKKGSLIYAFSVLMFVDKIRAAHQLVSEQREGGVCQVVDLIVMVSK